MSWLYLLAAILLEVCGTTCMKLSHGFTRLAPSVLLFVFYALAFVAVTLAVKRIEIGTAYAIWSGLGTALIALIGILWFKESLSFVKLASLTLIILGIVGLNLSVQMQ
jgi:small multidrug resistance pump